MVVKMSVDQGWEVGRVPTYLQKCPYDGVGSTPLPIKILSLTSPLRHRDSNQKGKCVKTGQSDALKPVSLA